MVEVDGMATLHARLLAAPMLALLLGSCSYTYELRAVVIDQQLAFIVDPSSQRRPDCIEGIEVRVLPGGLKAGPAEGDDRSSVLESVYWRTASEPGSCPNTFPVFYGAPLRGVLPGGVEPQRLRPEVIYHVAAESRGSGYGVGRFKLTKEGRVENLP